MNGWIFYCNTMTQYIKMYMCACLLSCTPVNSLLTYHTNNGLIKQGINSDLTVIILKKLKFKVIGAVFLRDTSLTIFLRDSYVPCYENQREFSFRLQLGSSMTISLSRDISSQYNFIHRSLGDKTVDFRIKKQLKSRALLDFRSKSGWDDLVSPLVVMQLASAFLKISDTGDIDTTCNIHMTRGYRQLLLNSSRYKGKSEDII